MPDRQVIARRHGIPHLADQLVGETPAELEADAAARAALMQMFGPRDMNVEPEPTEPTGEGLPPRDKPFSEYSPEEWQATHADHERRMLERESEGKRADAERRAAEANRTPEEQHGDTIASLLRHDAKAERNLALARSLHPEEET